MLETLLEMMPKEELKKWNINLIPPLLFWGGGIVVWYESNGWGLNFLWDKFQYLQKLNYMQIGLILLLLILLLIISQKFVQFLQFPLVRFIEGYWFFPLSILSSCLVKRIQLELDMKNDEWNNLAKVHSKLKSPQRKRYIELEVELENYPSFLLFPTKFGNILRAAEEYPSDRYGLETMRVWPSLWLLMPDKTREELSTANEILYNRVTLFFWSSVFCLWTFVAWKVWNTLILWPLIFSIVGAIFVYYIGLIPAASNFGDLLRASFDLHRFDLYEALHLPLPSSPNSEDQEGECLSQYLKRGLYPNSNAIFKHTGTENTFDSK